MSMIHLTLSFTRPQEEQAKKGSPLSISSPDVATADMIDIDLVLTSTGSVV
jgi:hypothetical protein